MSLKDRIEADFKQAVRQKEAVKISTLRLIKAAVKNKEIEKRGALDEGQLTAVLAGMAKQARESIEQFEKGGRRDLVDKEKTELAILEGYLPKQISAAELTGLVDKTVKELGGAGPKDMGKVMKAVMGKVQGQADGKQVQELVKKALGAG